MHRRHLVLACLALLAACNLSERVDPLPDSVPGPHQILSYAVEPEDTEPDLTTGLETQYAYLPAEASARVGRLVIFIPGTFGQPQGYLRIVQAAAQYGYHAFGIAYQNDRPIGNYCGTTTDSTCTE
ncbi:MAG TPA: hypothetical protein DCP28_04895, partial [Cytophagales bacterium]|nr:hypothetical protein [Cytophagales bacterium]